MVIANVRSRVVVALNECGYRIGQTRHNARIADAIVDQIRDRHEYDGWGYLKIAREFRLSKNTVRKICTYERRAHTPVRWKTLKVANGKEGTDKKAGEGSCEGQGDALSPQEL